MAPADDADRVPASDGLTFETVGAKPRRRWLRYLVGLALFAGGGSAALYGFNAGWYGQKSSSVPIVHANKDPIKVKPEKPGGMKVPDRDKLIYERLGTGAKKPQAPVEKLLPPAEAPMPPPTDPQALKAKPLEPVKTVAKPSTEPPPPLKSPLPSVERLAPPPSPQKVEKVVPKNMLPKKPAAKVVERIPPPSAPTEVILPEKKMTQKLAAKKEPSKPLPPIESLLSDKPAKEPAAKEKATAKQALKTVAGKPYHVQLAAVRSRAIAEKEWKRIQKKNNDVLGKLSLSVMRADLGAKGVYFRLRAGPIPSVSQARTLCKKLAARKVPCLVIRPNG